MDCGLLRKHEGYIFVHVYYRCYLFTVLCIFCLIVRFFYFFSSGIPMEASEQILSTSAFIRLVKSVKTSHQLLLYKDINIYNTQKN